MAEVTTTVTLPDVQFLNYFSNLDKLNEIMSKRLPAKEFDEFKATHIEFRKQMITNMDAESIKAFELAKLAKVDGIVEAVDVKI